ncbi:hypothetical protein D3C74_286980 [compost metagenome]
MQSDFYTISICKKFNATDYECDINSDLYVKLRDFAKALQGTEKQFAVGYDSAKKKTNLLSGQAYKPVGGELKKSSSGSILNVKPSNAGLLLNGQAVAATDYTINGSTYYKLLDLCKMFKLPVSNRISDNRIRINTYSDVVSVGGTTLERSSDDYYYSNSFNPSNRFLYKSGGQLQVLEASSSQLIIHTFSSNYKELGQKKVPMELPLFGGFHQSQDGYYYVIYGQYNREDSDSKVVYRVVKYDASWKKIAQADITNVYVSRPFYASNVTMDSYNDKLIIHSGRLNYFTPDDGLRHQSNISFLIDTKTMTVLSGELHKNHVSHSFATYVRFDGNRIVYVDHSDGYPSRSIVLQVQSDGSIDKSNLISYPGKYGDNSTGASLGGLEVSSLNYLVVGSDTYTKGSKNVFLSVVRKNAQQISDLKTIWLTNYTTKSKEGIKNNQTHLVKLSDNKFVVMWEELVEGGEPSVVYAVVDGSGSIIQKPKKLLGVPSPGNMMPLVQNGNLTWYYFDPLNMENTVDWYTLRIQ